MANKHHQMYIKNLRKHIPTEYQNTEQFVSSISQDIENYLENHADADYDMLCLEFGSPEELAASLMEEFTPTQINETFSKQRKMKRIIYALSTLLLIFLFLWFIAIPNMAVEITETLIIYETKSTEIEAH